jgi:hypothetical protein
MKWYAVAVELKKHGTVLNHARAEKFTQAEVAARLNVAQNMVSKMETHGFAQNSRISETTVALYHQFADIVGVPRFDFGPVILDRDAQVRLAPVVRASSTRATRVQPDSKSERDTVIIALLKAAKAGHLTPESALAAISAQF